MNKLNFYLFPLALFLISMLSLSCTATTDNETQEGSEIVPEQNSEKKTILIFGDSMTAGYGVEKEEAFPALVQDAIDTLNLDFQVINGGLSGETSAGGLTRIDWFMEDEPAIFVLELGGNDGLRGIDLSETKKNLQQIIDKVKTKYPATEIVLAGMQIPPNMGKTYSEEFRDMFPALAKNNDLVLIPFLLDGVGGDPKLNQADGIHPTPEGHKIIAKTVWKYLEPIVREKS
ncbi:arylesterase [Echinicola pacifica]|nr:arylesterase [Echinicola pacifica]